MRKFLILLSLLFCGVANADTETITWYVGNDVYDTTTCQSGDDVILPTAPSRYGYSFHGWEAVYDMSTLDTSIEGEVFYGRCATGICIYRNSLEPGGKIEVCSSNYADLASREWKTLFSYGLIHGESACSSTVGTTQGEVSNPNLSNPNNGGQYCWCRVTEFIPTGEDIAYKPMVSPWTFTFMYSSVSACTQECANGCGASRLKPFFREALYGL